MKNNYYRITPEAVIDKTRLEYSFSRAELEKLRQAFSEVESTEIYPSFDPDFLYVVNFYNTDSYFLKKLRSYCRRKLVPPVVKTDYRSFIGRLVIYLIIFLFLLYFIFNFLRPFTIWLIQAVDLVQSDALVLLGGCG